MDITQLKSWANKNAAGLQVNTENATVQAGINPSVVRTLDDSIPYAVNVYTPYVQGGLYRNVNGQGTNTKHVSAELPVGPVRVKGTVQEVGNNYGYSDKNKSLGLAAKFGSGDVDAKVSKNLQGDVTKSVGYYTPFMGGSLQGNYYSNPYNKGLAVNYSRRF